MKKLFREHRGGLRESLETAVEVEGIDGIRDVLAGEYAFITDDTGIVIDSECVTDSRLPEEWGGVEYRVLAEVQSVGTAKSTVCMGFCNFRE